MGPGQNLAYFYENAKARNSSPSSVHSEASNQLCSNLFLSPSPSLPVFYLPPNPTRPFPRPLPSNCHPDHASHSPFFHPTQHHPQKTVTNVTPGRALRAQMVTSVQCMRGHGS
ncbi:hypothetical protein RRG08_001163 [Elysia crispata]|uniref:Uncharacterized protein n=1 Tax=Elysia crispata TaxID=231223 RepID=A0AAE1A4I9_9GAST|nr:hypothetical protein RRG08_001163 [Elysia crispata]